jgi:hypothetical protein
MLQTRLLGSAALLALTLSMGQTQPPPAQWSIVTSSQIKPEFRTEYEAFMKEITAAYKKAGVPYRIVVQTILGDVAEYTSVTPLANFADMDGPSPIAKALGEAASQKLLKRGGTYLLSVHRVAVLGLTEISLQSGDIGEYVHITTFHLHPGKGGDFTAFMKDAYLPAMKKAGVTNLFMNEPVFGGNTNDRVMVQPMHKIGELDGGPLLRKALGVDGARLLNIKQATIVDSVEHMVGHVRADLSILPSAPPATK